MDLTWIVILGIAGVLLGIACCLVGPAFCDWCRARRRQVAVEKKMAAPPKAQLQPQPQPEAQRERQWIAVPVTPDSNEVHLIEVDPQHFR
jgi:hypothetical protein